MLPDVLLDLLWYALFVVAIWKSAGSVAARLGASFLLVFPIAVVLHNAYLSAGYILYGDGFYPNTTLTRILDMQGLLIVWICIACAYGLGRPIEGWARAVLILIPIAGFGPTLFWGAIGYRWELWAYGGHAVVAVLSALLVVGCVMLTEFATRQVKRNAEGHTDIGQPYALASPQSASGTAVGYTSSVGQTQAGPPLEAKWNTMAIVAFIFGLVSIALVGLILGGIALNQIKRTGERGRGLAIAAIVIGLIWVALVIIGAVFFSYLFAQIV